MIKVYVQADNINYGITNISLLPLRNNYIEATLENSTIDLSKIDHYFLVQKCDETYSLVYDEDRYNQMIEEEKKNVAIEEGNKKLDEMQEKLALKYATDDDAYIMRYLYDMWKADTDYVVDDRRMYNDILYKCKQKHTSQAQHTPDLIPAIWDIINPDSENGTIGNPIKIPSNFSSMIYVKGKYYIEDGKIYLMNREGMQDGEEISLSHKPSQLVGHYFKPVEQTV